MTTIATDTREIVAILFTDSHFRVGDNDVTRIEAYGEPGDESFKAAVRIWRGGDLHAAFMIGDGVVIYAVPNVNTIEAKG